MNNAKAIAVLKWLRNNDYVSQYMKQDVHEACDVAIRLLKEQKTGHWTAINEPPNEEYECSNCGYYISTYDADTNPHEEYDICPNCGAKMEVE